VREASGVWIVGSDAAQVASALDAAEVVDELRAVLERQVVVGGNAAGGAALARLFANTPTNDEADAAPRGLDLLPGVAVMPGFEDDETHSRLVRLVEAHPGNVGVGIEDNCALFVRGRRLRVLGEGKVTLALAESPTRAARTIEVKSGEVADFTALRRMAAGRAQGAFPLEEPGVPEVENGTLVIIGGGGLPVAAMRRFIEAAGGPDALIVVLPTADPSPTSGEAEKRVFGEAGARNVVVHAARTLEEVDCPESLDLLRRAGGIWFGGGRQWRFVDTYENTKAHAAMLEMLHRGGVIGGSSAGATIQGEYLCRGNPLGNADIMSEGYERGLGFLPGTAIDQHFAQRNRFADMTALMRTYPQFLGIGIDETTALIVRGHVGEVVGRGSVHFYDYRERPDGESSRDGADDADGDQHDYVSVHPGGRFDLKARRVLDLGTKRENANNTDREARSADETPTP
jgi:cyanophycinase